MSQTFHYSGTSNSIISILEHYYTFMKQFICGLREIILFYTNRKYLKNYFKRSTSVRSLKRIWLVLIISRDSTNAKPKFFVLIKVENIYNEFPLFYIKLCTFNSFIVVLKLTEISYWKNMKSIECLISGKKITIQFFIWILDTQ